MSKWARVSTAAIGELIHYSVIVKGQWVDGEHGGGEGGMGGGGGGESMGD